MQRVTRMIMEMGRKAYTDDCDARHRIEHMVGAVHHVSVS